MEAVALQALAPRVRAGKARRRASAGWVAWKAVSKQATCGRSGSCAASARIAATLCGWWWGARGSSAASCAMVSGVSRQWSGEGRAAMDDAVAGAGERRRRGRSACSQSSRIGEGGAVVGDGRQWGQRSPLERLADAGDLRGGEVAASLAIRTAI